MISSVDDKISFCILNVANNCCMKCFTSVSLHTRREWNLDLDLDLEKHGVISHGMLCFLILLYFLKIYQAATESSLLLYIYIYFVRMTRRNGKISLLLDEEKHPAMGNQGIRPG